MTQPFLSLVVIHRRAKRIGEMLDSLRASYTGPLHVDEIVLVHTGPDDDDEATSQGRRQIKGFIESGVDLPIVEAEYRCPEEVEIGGVRYIGHFGKAREFAHGLASGMWTIYLDADDELAVGRELGMSLSEWVRRCARDERQLTGIELSAISLPYFYGPGMRHSRTRIWNGGYAWKWIGRVHEERRPIDGSIPSVLEVGLDDYPCVYHARHELEKSWERNKAIIQAAHPESPRGLRSSFVFDLPTTPTSRLGIEAWKVSSAVLSTYSDPVGSLGVQCLAAVELLSRDDVGEKDVDDLVCALVTEAFSLEGRALLYFAVGALLCKAGFFQEACRAEQVAAALRAGGGPAPLDSEAAQLDLFEGWIDRAHRALGQYTSGGDRHSIYDLVSAWVKREEPEIVRRLLDLIPPEICSQDTLTAFSFKSVEPETRTSLFSPQIGASIAARGLTAHVMRMQSPSTWTIEPFDAAPGGRVCLVADNLPFAEYGELARKSHELRASIVVLLNRREAFVSSLEPLEQLQQHIGVYPIFVDRGEGVLVTWAQPDSASLAYDVVCEGGLAPPSELTLWVRRQALEEGRTMRLWDCQLRVGEERVEESMAGVMECAGERFTVGRVERGVFCYCGPPARLVELAGQGREIVYYMGRVAPEGRWAPAYLAAKRVVLDAQHHELFLSLYRGDLLVRARAILVSDLNLA